MRPKSQLDPAPAMQRPTSRFSDKAVARAEIASLYAGLLGVESAKDRPAGAFDR